MKMCQAHWKELKAAIEERGLMRFVSGDGGQAYSRLANRLEGSASNEDYDPLMSACFNIYAHALDRWGLLLMTEDAPCPLCLNDEHAKSCTNPQCSKPTGADWIRLAADAELEDAKSRGLVVKPN